MNEVKEQVNVEKVSVTQEQCIADLLFDLNSGEMTYEYTFTKVCPHDIVKILENYPEFDEWIWTTVPEGDYKLIMYITGDIKMKGIFDLWNGTITLLRDE